MVNDKVLLTEEGYKKLLEELKYLKEVKKKEVAERIADARSMGDLSENSEYHAAKEEMAHIEERIHTIETILDNAEIIDTSSIDLDKVVVGVTVTLKDLNKNKLKKYTLVGNHEEVDIYSGKISTNSSLGKAILGKRVGDIVEFVSPSGKLMRYEVIDISID